VRISVGQRAGHPTDTLRCAQQTGEFVIKLILGCVLRFHVRSDPLLPYGLANALRLGQESVFKINSVV
jgi:hypothetical protein